MTKFRSIFAAAVLAWAFAGPAAAEDAPATAQPAATAKVDDVKPSDNPPDADLTPQEKAEKEARKACKVAICQAFHSKQEEGANIACTVVKSWRKEQLGKLVGKLKVSWPYGGVRCTSALNLKRAELVQAMTDDKREVTLDKHAVACVVEREQDAPTDIKFDFSPAITFEKGKAVHAKINWGKIEAPPLIKTALWTATAADNTVNLLSSTLVEDINDFVDKKCDEVKDQWAAK